MGDRKVQRYTEVFAHRGWSAKFPENTIPAFTAALQVGSDGLEFDVHVTKDGEIVVIHDGELGRTLTGQGWIEDKSLAELKALDAGGWFQPQFAGEQIPTLDEVLQLVAQMSPTAKMNIEIKTGRGPYPHLAERVWECVRAYGLGDRTIFSSFNHFLLRNLRLTHPEAPIAVLYSEALVDPWRYAVFLGAEGLHPGYDGFDESVVRDAHAVGRHVRPYTVNDRATMLRMLSWGVDAIITDHPDKLIAVRKELYGGR